MGKVIMEGEFRSLLRIRPNAFLIEGVHNA
jgi:hypothetical protein